MTSIDTLIVKYSDKKFDADTTARSFFSAHSANEVNKKLAELGTLQVSFCIFKFFCFFKN
jgi:hypothetical protein